MSCHRFRIASSEIRANALGALLAAFVNIGKRQQMKKETRKRLVEDAKKIVMGGVSPSYPSPMAHFDGLIDVIVSRSIDLAFAEQSKEDSVKNIPAELNQAVQNAVSSHVVLLPTQRAHARVQSIAFVQTVQNALPA
jgi:hypothetical protein